MSGPLRVAIDGAALGSGIGGDETFVRSVLDGLAHHQDPGLDVHLYAPVDAPVPDGPFTVHRLPRRRGVAHFAVDLPRALWADRTENDLVLSVTHAPLLPTDGRVLVVGDLSFEHLPDAFPKGTRRRLRAIVRQQARACRMVVTPSEFSRQDVLEQYGLAPERVMVVPNRVTPPGPPDPDAAARAAALGVRPPFVLYLGNRHPRKNLARLVDAFAAARAASPLVREQQLVLAGTHWWADGLHGREVDGVLGVGWVDDGVREHLLRTATLLAYPSVFEGFGLPPLEAMAVGTPVLSSRTTSIPEVCGDAALLVDPLDTQAIAAGLRDLCEDAALRARLVAAGRTRAAHFDAARTGAAAVTAFRAAASLGPRRHDERTSA